jgi:murein DD-endopeptidase MepM/ murein hydrolase activator NlpD
VKFLTIIQLPETPSSANCARGTRVLTHSQRIRNVFAQTLSTNFVHKLCIAPLRNSIINGVPGKVVKLFLICTIILLALNCVLAQSLVNYTIVKDDTLWKIANTYGADVGEIKRINNLTSDALFVGQVVQVPYTGGLSAPVTLQRSGVVQHTVAQGDTLANIAARYTLSEETLRRSNPGYDGVLAETQLAAGLILAIAPAEGTVITVQSGQNMLAIALQNGMTVSELSKLNGIKRVQAGQYVFIPASALAGLIQSGSIQVGSTQAVQVQTSGVLKASAATTTNSDVQRSSRTLHLEAQKALLGRASSLLASYTPPTPTQSFIWPLSGRLTSYYGRRNISVNGNTFHAGLDIAAKIGTPIAASRPGTVTKASWGGSYGYVVFIDHGDGSQTRYAHQSQLGVRVGQYVNQGDIVGFVGTTGASTGPHVHFEIRFDGRSVDPLGYLPQE